MPADTTEKYRIEGKGTDAATLTQQRLFKDLVDESPWR